MPKYSIVIPTLNGYNGLKVTIPYILSSVEGDFEVVVSVNHSNDETLSFLQKIPDVRLRVVQPSMKLPHSEHLNFAYSHARGEWMGHIGDDDLIFPNRFQLLDEIVESCDLVVGDSIRYVWPGNLIEKENTISDNGFLSRTGRLHH